MATGTSKAAPLSLYAETEEEQQYLKEYRDAQAKLREALESRQSQLFDPTLLAMAQGFLAPTKTGGFGESLGNVAAMLGPVQEQEQKRNLEMAQIRRELAAQELGMAQQARGEREFRQLIGGPGASAAEPSTAAADVKTIGGAGAAPSGAAPGELRPLTELDVLAASQMPGQEEKAKRLLELMKTQRDRFQQSANGIVFDRATKQYLDIDIPGQKQEPFSTPYGTFNMTPNEYARFIKAEQAGQGNEWMRRFTTPGGMTTTGAAATPSATGAIQAPGRQTVSQAEASSAAAKAEAEAGARSRAEQTTAVRNAGKAALSLLPTYDRMEVLIKAPGMDQVMGVLERGDVISGLGSLVEEAVRLGSFSVGIPAVRKIIAQTGAPQDVIDRAAELGQLLAMTQFEQRKGLGSGTSVSTFEQQMVNAMGPNMTDTLRSFGQKLNFMREKAKFEHELSVALRKSKMQYEDFEDTPEFKRLFGDYRRRVTEIVYPGKKQFEVVR